MFILSAEGNKICTAGQWHPVSSSYISKLRTRRMRTRMRMISKMGDLTHAKWFAKCNGLGYCAGMKYFAAFAGLVFAFAPLHARALSMADDQYFSIYSLIQQADSLQAAGQLRQALDEYTQAGQQLGKFQKVFPDWNPRIVNFRLHYLSQKISDLTAQVPAAPKNGTSPATAAETAAPTANDGVAPAVTAAGQAQLSALQAQLRNLQSENAVLQDKLKEALSAQPATSNPQELAQAQAQIKSLLKENELLRAGPAQEKMTNAVQSADAGELQLSLTDAKQKLTEQTSRADKLAEENEALRTRLQPLLASADAMQALREENALLKGQVAALEAAPTNSADANAEVVKLRTQVAVLQSDADMHWLERAALERKLRQFQPAAANANSEASSDFSVAHTSSATEQTEADANTEAKSINQLPSGSAALVDEAQRYFSDHQYDKAQADYEKILQLDPNNALALANLAAIETEENKLPDAEQHIKAALARNPNDAYNLSIYGYLKFRQQKYDDAIEALNRAAKLDSKNPQVQNYLGVSLSQKGRQPQAEEALRRAIELDPNYAAAHNNLAVIYINEQPPKI